MCQVIETDVNMTYNMTQDWLQWKEYIIDNTSSWE